MPDVVDLTLSDNDDNDSPVEHQENVHEARWCEEGRSRARSERHSANFVSQLDTFRDDEDKDKAKLESRLAEVEKRMHELENERCELQQRARDEDDRNQALMADNAILQNTVKQKDGDIARLELENMKTASQLEGKTASFLDLERKLSAEKSSSESLKKQHGLLEQKVRELEAEVNKFPKQKQEAFEDGKRAGEQKKDGDIARLELQNRKTVSQLEGKTASFLDLERKLSAEKSSSESLKKQKGLLEQKVRELEAEVNKFPKQKQEAFEDGKRAGEQKKEGDNVNTQRRLTIQQNQIAVKDKECARLSSELKEKGLSITKMHEKNEDLRRQVSEHKKLKQTKDKTIASLQEESRQQKSEIQSLKAKVEMLPQSKEQIRKQEPLAGRHAAPGEGANKKISKINRGLSTVPPGAPQDERAAPDGAPQQRHVSLRVPRATHFSMCYMYGRGDPKKLEQRGRDLRALPYDDAFGATSSFFVLCDGVGGGKDASGRWARQCVEICLQESGSNFSGQALPRPGEDLNNAAAEIVDRSMKALKCRDLEPPKDCNATTTLLALKLKSHIDGCGHLQSSIDACEIGDSRWALLCWDDSARTYQCQHLAEARVFLDPNYLCPPPYQIRHPKQNFGQSADFYFQKDYREQVLHSVPVKMSKSFGRAPLVVAGSDGLWDNLLGSEDLDVHEQSRRLKELLTKRVNEFLDHHGDVNKNYVEALGSYLKRSVIHAMARDGKHVDDVSIFVGKIEAADAARQSSHIIDRCFFEGRLSHTDIQEGVERCVSNDDLKLKPGDARDNAETKKRPAPDDPRIAVKHAKHK